jgi:hypothetical protein
VRYTITYLLEPISYFLFLSALLCYLRIGNVKLRHKVICIYYLIGFILLAKIVFTRHNAYLYSLVYLLTSIFFAYYFYLLFQARQQKWFAVFTGAITLIYYLYHAFFLKDNILFPSVGYVMTSTGVVILIFLLLNQLMRNVNEDSLTLNFDFWFICSQLIYHLGAFGIFLTYNHLTAKILPTEHFSDENRYLLTNLWGAHNVLLFIASLITCFGVIWILRRNRKK